MTPESEEKQKYRPLNRKSLLRALVICVFLLLLPFAGMLAYKWSLYYIYHGLWEQNYSGDYIVFYWWFESPTASLPARSMTDDEFWYIASECLKNSGCEVNYSQEYYLPELINSHDGGIGVMQLHSIYNCGALPRDNESLQMLQLGCQGNGFEPITNNE